MLNPSNLAAQLRDAYLCPWRDQRVDILKYPVDDGIKEGGHDIVIEKDHPWICRAAGTRSNDEVRRSGVWAMEGMLERIKLLRSILHNFEIRQAEFLTLLIEVFQVPEPRYEVVVHKLRAAEVTYAKDVSSIIQALTLESEPLSFARQFKLTSAP